VLAFSNFDSERQNPVFSSTEKTARFQKKVPHLVDFGLPNPNMPSVFKLGRNFSSYAGSNFSEGNKKNSVFGFLKKFHPKVRAMPLYLGLVSILLVISSLF